MVPSATPAVCATSRICTASYPPSAPKLSAASITRPRRAAWLFVSVDTAWAIDPSLPCLPREPEDPLPHDVSLDLVGSAADRGLHRIDPLLLEHTVDG